MNKTVENCLRQSVMMLLAAAFAMLCAFIMSYWAEPFEQEVGLGNSILGYNRDFLVDGRWWFMAAMVACFCLALLSQRKIAKS